MSTSRLCPVLLCLCLIPSRLAAQTPVTLVIESDRVRFTTPGEALDWRLEITTQQDQSVFDSAFINGGTLEWPLVNDQGQPIESGLYHYTVTIRNARSGAMRTHRGDLTIERTSTISRVAATADESRGDTLLTVVPGALEPAATRTKGVAAAPATSTDAGSADRSFRPTLGAVTFAGPQPLISGSGTTGRMTKWSDGPSGVVADTHVTESNGAMVVGNGSFSGNIQIFGTALGDVFAGMGPDVISGPAFNFGYAGATFGRSAGFFNVRPDASAVAPNPSLRFMTANVQRMIITNTGDVGIGTSTPNAKLRVVAGGSATGVFGSSSTGVGVSGSSALGSGVSGSSAQGAGVSGESVNHYGVFGHSDNGPGVVGESGNHNGVWGRSEGNAVRGDSTGGIGVRGSSSSGVGVSGLSDTHTGVYGASATGLAGSFVGDVQVSGNLTVNGTCFCTLSDARLKQDITPLTYGLRQVLQLRPVSWHWKNRPTTSFDVGLIAQEVEPLLPELVQRATDDPDELLRLNYVGLVPVLIRAIQEQQAALEQKDAEIQRLHARDRDLEIRLAALEARLQQLLKESPTSDLNKRY